MVTKGEIDPVLERLRAVAANREFCDLVPRGQAHSDLVVELMAAAADLAGVRAWRMSAASYPAVALYTERGVIFAHAAGMQEIALRVPASQLREALEEGATRFAPAGPQWVAFAAFKLPIDTTRERIRRWCRLAWAAAR